MDIFDLSASLTLDSSKYEQGLTDAEGGAKSFGSRLAGVLKTGAKAFAAVGAAATVAGAAIGKMALDAYADYQQLEGGVKKLFGESADQVMQYAKNAYETAGMSANQYMEQATSFSAALINSLDGNTAKAAKQTDVAMRAISDNFNTFGGDISMIQGAFQGFAKQNYTMLDNLKLGYGGTKQEMERLIDDANEYAKANGMAADLSIESFSDIVTAIDLIQQKQHIAGTTAREASTTISGSIGMVKAAWENLLAGFANPDADISKLVDNLVTSVGTAAQNILPAIVQMAEGFGQALNTFLPQMFNIIIEALPKLVEIGGQIIQALIQGIMTAIPQILEALPQILEMGVQIVQALAQGIVTAIPKIVEAFTANIDQIIQTAVLIIEALVDGLILAMPKIIDAIPKIITALVTAIIDNLPRLVMAGLKLIVALVKGIIQAIPKIIAMAPKIIKALVGAIGGLLGQLVSAGVRIVVSIATGIGNAISRAVAKARELISQIWQAIKSAIGKFADIGLDIVKGIWNGISNGFGWIKSKITGWVGNVKSFFKKLFKIKSPSRWARDEIGWNIAKGLALGIEDGESEVEDAMSNLMPDYAIDTAVVGGNLEDALQVSIGGAVTEALTELTPILQQGMADAMEGISVKLNSRNFGRFAREAVNGTL